MVHLCLQRWQNPPCPPLSKGEREAPGDLRHHQRCANLVWFDLGGLLGLAVGLVNPIEHSSVAEMSGVGLLSAGEHLFDREQVYHWKVCGIGCGH